MFGASGYGANGYRRQDKGRVVTGLAGTLSRLMAAGLVGASLAASIPAFAEQPDPPAAAPLTGNAGMGTGDVPLTTPLPPVTAPAPRAVAATPAPVSPAAPATRVRGGVDSAGDTAQTLPLTHSAPPAQAQSAPTSTPAQPAATIAAPAPAATPAPAAPPVTVAVEDPLAPVAEAIAALLATPETVTASKKEQEALVAFYGARQNMPVFVGLKGIDARGKAVIARFEAAGEDGLEPTDYAVPAPKPGATASDLARTELKLAVAVLTYARHAQAGRFDPGRISALVTPVREIPDPTAVLAKVAYAPDANAALAAYNPTHAGYRALKAQLARVTGQTPGVVAVPPGAQIRPGASDPRIPTLRTRLGVTGRPADDNAYDPALVDAVKAFQEASKIKPTGIVGPSTIAALNAGATPGGGSLKSDVIANMERWRWLPRDLGESYVMVNIPEFLVRIYQSGHEIHETRVVVGKPETPTPLLSREMQYIVVNPAWNIPPSIARNEMMPLLRSDPSALSRRGIEVVRNGSGGYSFRQVPSERNALGRIKFMFPNDHSVYLHDTPSKALFQNDRRAYSHGCVRVYEPLKFGEVIFNLGLPNDHWTQTRIGKMFGSSERYVNLKQRFPVHIVYFNVVVDDAGRLAVREDLYGINAETKTLLGLNGKQRIADGTSTRGTAPKTR
ncbi:Peptidoglycan-binding domain 1 protein [Xanthobacter versatilis]|uniref:Peptidoglycan-binding domain 1 protein n=1 Tax=Xanthobacter autotrophicus (strain ATCC BAA-1158 / Py2) TaxID=78245 RepID=A7IH19_XANP2|nr:Peptidoglycan-binding domain 1 protein [Xanthobacter autotrophicus Py2]